MRREGEEDGRGFSFVTEEGGEAVELLDDILVSFFGERPTASFFPAMGAERERVRKREKGELEGTCVVCLQSSFA